MARNELTHVDAAGAARMVDVSGKTPTARTAVASGVVRTTAEVVQLLERDGLPKGDALATARIAGIMAAKRTGELRADALPLLARGAALRFLLTRLVDFLDVPQGALVRPKDPLEYVRKLRFQQGVATLRDYGVETSGLPA